MPLFDLFWSMLWFFVFVAWLVVMGYVVVDVFRRSDLNGWAKGAWILLVILIPWLGVFSYVVVAGRGMAERIVTDQRQRARRRGGGVDDTSISGVLNTMAGFGPGPGSDVNGR